MIEVLQFANLVLRLVLELGVLFALFYAGYRMSSRSIVRIPLAIVAPLLAGALWITFGAPGGERSLDDPWRLLLEIAIFGAAAVGLVAAGRVRLGLAFFLLFALNRGLMYLWGQ
ncbi:MAG: hypothetical protein AUH85_04845 [Chloroflexi bacterium 13_1_40CM_4_68_4]|nr:MAG: hypothetical protein AUH85_04845 [Chloroflexi bacterium 13_1_40CM_4_68_4]